MTFETYSVSVPCGSRGILATMHFFIASIWMKVEREESLSAGNSYCCYDMQRT